MVLSLNEIHTGSDHPVCPFLFFHRLSVSLTVMVKTDLCKKKEKPLGATMQVHTVNTFPNTKNVCIFCIFCILCKCLKLWSEPVTLKVKRTSQSLCAYSSLGKSNNSWWWWWSGSCRITFRRERAHSCDTSSSAPQEVCSHTVLNAVQSPSMDCRWLIRRPFVRPLSSGYTGLDLKRPLGLILGAITHK